MIHFIGAGPGGEDLITVRGARLLGEADVIIYAGSLVNPALLKYKREGCVVHDIPSASTPGTPPSTGPFGSRWTSWTGWGWPTT